MSIAAAGGSKWLHQFRLAVSLSTRSSGYPRPARLVDAAAAAAATTITRSQDNRSYTSTPVTNMAWWNPFSRGGSQRDGGAQLGSTARTHDDDAPRRIQERKDTTLALLALGFRKLSLEHPNLEREEVVDMAFDALEQKEVDGKTILQMRHELQVALESQVVELFQAMGKVDEILSFDQDELGETGNAILDRTLQMELEQAIDELANSAPTQAPKGTSPKTYFAIKRGALESLLKLRQASQITVDATSGPAHESDDTSDEPQPPDEKRVSWVDADEFGYHETIDADRNQQIRQFQAINMCRAAKMRDDWGFSVVALRSSVAGAGRGVYVDGYAKAGSILVFQPGEVWSKEHLVNLPVEVERQLEKNDHYQMSLRSDDYMIDSRMSPYTVLTGKNSNLMALGHIVNHPTPTNPPNCRTVMVNFTQGMELGSSLKQYIPNTYARPRALTMMGGLWDREAIDMHGMSLIATRDICNEELFYDYRLMTSQLPSWYHPVQDTAYTEPESEETRA